MRIRTDTSPQSDRFENHGDNQHQFFKEPLRINSNQNFALPIVSKKKIKTSVMDSGPPTNDRLGRCQSKLTAPDSNDLLDISTIRKPGSVSIRLSLQTETQRNHPTDEKKFLKDDLKLNLEDSRRAMKKDGVGNHRRLDSHEEFGDINKLSKSLIKPGMQLQRLLPTNSAQILKEPIEQSKSIKFDNFVSQSTRNLPKKRHKDNTISTSVNVLPAIGTDIDYQDAFSHVNSKVEVNRKRIQNFLANGSVSKQFLSDNKKELQKLLKNKERASSDYFRGYETFSVANKTDRMPVEDSKKSLETLFHNKSKDFSVQKQGSDKLFQPLQFHNKSMSKDYSLMSIKQKAGGPANLLNFQTSPQQSINSNRNSMPKTTPMKMSTDEYVFPSNVKLEKQIQGERVNLSTHQLEAWVNETLSEAYHLEIPGAVMSAEKKKPVSCYGIDPLTLMDSGVSKEDVTRIYRSLFVYSVGFFEFLKKILERSASSYAIIISIWKVYQILLEYSCKTDYRMLITELSDRHNAELNDIIRKNNEKLANCEKDLLIMQQNLEAQQAQCDHFEKDRDTEKTLRLKLEEEYMTHQMNHEEEVKLRIKFEGKFNVMTDEHRELQIQFDRKLREFATAQNKIKDLEDAINGQSQQICEMKERCVNDEVKITALEEFKTMAQKEIEKKTKHLIAADQQRLQVLDDWHLERYEVQESHKDRNKIKTEMEILQARINELETLCEAAKKDKSIFEAERDKFKEKYESISHEFEKRQGAIDEVSAQLKASKVKARSYHRELEDLRLKQENTSKQFSNLSYKYASMQAKEQKLDTDNNQLSKDVKNQQFQLQEMNTDRHTVIEKLEKMTQKAKELEENLESALVSNRHLKDQLYHSEQHLNEAKKNAAIREENLRNTIENLRNTKEELYKELQVTKANVMSLEVSLGTSQELVCGQRIEINNFEQKTAQQAETVIKLTERNQHLEMEVHNRYSEMMTTKRECTKAIQDRHESIQNLSIAEQVKDTLMQTVKSLKAQLRDERSVLEQQKGAYYMQMQLNRERDFMANEEVVSRYGQMKEENKAAIRMRDENQARLDHYQAIQDELKQIEIERQQAQEQIEGSQKRIDWLLDQIKEKDAELQAEKQKSKTELFNLQTEHNIEVNELEQKIIQVKQNAQKDKSEVMKEKRDAQAKVKELQKQIKEKTPRPSAGSKQAKGAKTPAHSKPDFPPVMADKGTQTSEKNHEKKLIKTQKLLEKTQKTLERTQTQLEQTKSQLKKSYSVQSLKQYSEVSPEIMEDEEIESENKTKTKTMTNSASYQNGIQQANSVSSYKDEIQEEATSIHQELNDQGLDDAIEDIPKAEIHESMYSRQPELSVVEKQNKLIEFLVDQESDILKRIEDAAGQGQVIHQGTVSKWRSEIRIPAYLMKVNLTEEQRTTLVTQQQEQAVLFQERAIRKIEEGSDYSSDYEEVEVSDYEEPVQSAEEVEEIIKKQMQMGLNITVIRETPRASSEDSPEAFKEQQVTERQATTPADEDKSNPTHAAEDATVMKPANAIADERVMSPANPVADPRVMSPANPVADAMVMSPTNAAEDTKVKSPTNAAEDTDIMSPTNTAEGTEVKNPTNAAQVMESNLVADQSQKKPNLIDQLPIDISAVSNQKKKDEEVQIKIPYEDNSQAANLHSIKSQNEKPILFKLKDATKQPAITYIVQKDSDGKEVYKIKKVKKKKVLKERDDEYLEKREQILAAREKSTKVEQTTLKVSNLFEKFAANYTKMLDSVLEQSKNFRFNQAKARKLIKRQEDPATVAGRQLHHRLIAQMQEVPSFQKHKASLIDQLQLEKDKWNNREQNRLEEQQRQQELLKINSEKEKAKAQQRRSKIQIIREDLMVAAEAESPSLKFEGLSSQSQQSAQNTVQEDNVLHSSKNFEDQKQNISLQGMEPKYNEAKDDESVWSDDTIVIAVTQNQPNQRNAMNPQGEEDLSHVIQNHELQNLLEESKMHQLEQNQLDAQLHELTRGGVNAVSRRSQYFQNQDAQAAIDLQMQRERRAEKRDTKLLNVGMLPLDEAEKSPTKLGPSTIRTILKSAHSRDINH